MKPAPFDFQLPCLRCAVQFAAIKTDGVKIAATAAGPVPACREHFAAAGSDFAWRKSGVDIAAFAAAVDLVSQDYRAGRCDVVDAKRRLLIIFDGEFNRARGRPLGAPTQMRTEEKKGAAR